MTHDPLEQSPSQSQGSETGVHMLDVMSLPDSQRTVVNWVMRKKQATLAEVVEHTGESETVVQTMLEDLVQQGFLQATEVDGQQHYKTRLGSKPKSKLSQKIWDTLG